jgi:glycosyltransferase involved in cell wall biosynthesis
MKNLQVYPSSTPEVSVLTATFNREKLLPTCIESVIAQTYNNWEQLIIDDGSSDQSLQVIQKYMLSDPRIRCSRHSNRGQSLSLNVAIMMAAGEYVCILDSDDYYLPNHIESRIQYLQAHPEVDFLHGGIIVIGDEFVVDTTNPSLRINLNDCSVNGSFFGKTAAFRAVGGYRNIAFGNDTDLFARIEEQRFLTQKLTTPEYKTMVYCRTEDSITVQFEKNLKA